MSDCLIKLSRGDTSSLRCDAGYRLNTGSIEMTFVCKADNWINEENNMPFSKEIKCSPICERHCQNNGKCVDPNVCECHQDFIGDVCQFKKCKEPPTSIKNSELSFR